MKSTMLYVDPRLNKSNTICKISHEKMKIERIFQMKFDDFVWFVKVWI